MERFPIPYVLECMRFLCASPTENQRIIRDYEFDLYMGGERHVYIDGIYYHIKAGDLIFRRPGQSIRGIGDYDMYLLTLDFSQDRLQTQAYYRSSATPQQPICHLDIFQEIPTVFSPFHFDELKELYEKLCSCSYPNTVSLPLQRAYISEFLFLTLSDAYRHNASAKQIAQAGSRYIRQTCDYLQQSYAEEISTKQLAERFSLNKNYFIRLFKREMNVTPAQYVLELRLLRARHMLIQTDCSVEEIALACGFHTTSYFIKRFKLRFGSTPLRYRLSSQ